MTPIESDDIATYAWDQKKRLFEPEVTDLEVAFLFSFLFPQPSMHLWHINVDLCLEMGQKL